MASPGSLPGIPFTRSVLFGRGRRFFCLFPPCLFLCVFLFGVGGGECESVLFGSCLQGPTSGRPPRCRLRYTEAPEVFAEKPFIMMEEAPTHSASKSCALAFFATRPGPPVVPCYQLFWGRGSPTKIDYRKRVPLF